MFTFHDLEMKYGPVVAYQCLVEIERASFIEPLIEADPEDRLASAIAAQDGVLQLQAA